MGNSIDDFLDIIKTADTVVFSSDGQEVNADRFDAWSLGHERGMVTVAFNGSGFAPMQLASDITNGSDLYITAGDTTFECTVHGIPQHDVTAADNEPVITTCRVYLSAAKPV